MAKPRALGTQTSLQFQTHSSVLRCATSDRLILSSGLGVGPGHCIHAWGVWTLPHGGDSTSLTHHLRKCGNLGQGVLGQMCDCGGPKSLTLGFKIQTSSGLGGHFHITVMALCHQKRLKDAQSTLPKCREICQACGSEDSRCLTHYSRDLVSLTTQSTLLSVMTDYDQVPTVCQASC